MNNLVIRALPLARDSRTSRYATLLPGAVDFFTWEDHDTKRRFFKRGRLDYPLFASYPFFLLRLFFSAIAGFRQYQHIVCMDLDTYVPVRMGSFFCPRGRVVLDIVDPIAQTRFRKFGLRRIFDHLEIFIVRNARTVILPSLSRLEYYKEVANVDLSKLVSKVLLIENVPVLPTDGDGAPLSTAARDRKKIVIGYFGSLDDTRGIRELLDAFMTDNRFHFVVAGRGSLREEIIERSRDCKNLEYVGAYSSADLPSLYASVDFIWAYYDPAVFLHKFAAPNKYYEHLAFQTPMIVNSIVPQSRLVKERRTGVVIEDALTPAVMARLGDELCSFVASHGDFSEWETKYKTYYCRKLDLAKVCQ